jgi:hypothetical protein
MTHGLSAPTKPPTGIITGLYEFFKMQNAGYPVRSTGIPPDAEPPSQGPCPTTDRTV